MTSVTIGIPAYNEEANIQKLLRSIFKQKVSGFSIKRIIVLSDGSIDRTVKKTEQLRNPLCEIWNYKERKGKSYHLNTFFRKVNTDILILFDADVILRNEDALINLIKPLLKEKNVGLVSGDFQPIRVHNFIEKANKATINVFETLRHEFKGGHNVLGCTGRLMAIRKDLLKKLFVPHEMVLNDVYIYFDCLANGYEFRHVYDGHVYHQLPATVSDYISQYKRFIIGYHRMRKIFGQLYERETSILAKRMSELKLKEFLKSPIHCLFIGLINFVYKYLALLEDKKTDGKWKMAITTKKLIT